MERLFSDSPTGSISFPTLSDAMEKITELEDRIIQLEKLIKGQVK
jgi:hypothetical protein